MKRCSCGNRIHDRAQFIIWGCCYSCMRPKPEPLTEETRAETAAMLNEPDIVHNYTD